MAPSAADVLPVLGLVSGVFDPFMGPYVELERRNMEEMLQKAIEEDQVDRCVFVCFKWDGGRWMACLVGLSVGWL